MHSSGFGCSKGKTNLNIQKHHFFILVKDYFLLKKKKGRYFFLAAQIEKTHYVQMFAWTHKIKLAIYDKTILIGYIII